MKTRSLFSGIAIAILSGMLFAGGVTIADAEREERKRSKNRREQWDHGRERLRHFSVLEQYRRMWFNTSFVLGLEDAILVRAKDVYVKALYDINQEHQTKGHREIYKTFESQLRQTIGDENYEKLLVSVKPERGRRWLKISEYGRDRRSRARANKREARNRKDHLGKDKLPRIPN